jgi:hypothetical protein
VTDSEELALVSAALQQLYANGQSVTVLGRNYTRANLKDLQDRKDVLDARVKKSARGGIIRTQRAVGRG